MQWLGGGARDPLLLSNLSPADVSRAVEEVFRGYEAARERVLEGPVGRGKDLLYGLDDLMETLLNILGPLYLLAEVHPATELRRAAEAGVTAVMEVQNAFFADSELYNALHTFARKALTLMPHEVRFLQRLARRFQREGMALGPDERSRIQEINDSLVALELAFERAVAEDESALELSQSELSGMDRAFLERHAAPDGVFRIPLQTPSAMPVMKFCSVRETRQRLYMLQLNRATTSNGDRLKEILRLRREKARRLGHASFSAYQLEDKMAKNEEAVWRFLDELGESVSRKAEDEFQAFKHLQPQARIMPWDRFYLAEVLKKQECALDDELLKFYFPLDQVIEGLFRLCHVLFGVQFEPLPSHPTWHDDVRVFELRDPLRRLGLAYLDLFPRPGKFRHAAVFELRSRKQWGNAEQMPEAALVCNVSPEHPHRPSLLYHRDVEMLFHEFGHLLHHLLSTSPLGMLSGSRVVADFVETPSQVLENWVWDPRFLRGLARHVEDGTPLPSKILDSLKRLRTLTAGMEIQQQLFYSALDMGLHGEEENREPGQVVEEMQERYTRFPFVEGTHLEAGFTHLCGYASGYYGYLWSRVFAEDLFENLVEREPEDRERGMAFRRQILGMGDMEEPAYLMESFLGREPRKDAFLRAIGLNP